MATYRESREARAERLREWSAKRAEKAEAGFERASELASVIPMGQPILVGHYSEGRDRRYRARIDATGSRALEDSRTADRMASKADEIDRQAGHAIYSDDPDAIERLVERIAELEAKRTKIKAHNATARKEGRREDVLPAYVLQNLGGNIKRQRDRLVRLQRDAERAAAGIKKPARVLTARWASSCVECWGAIEAGATIHYRGRGDTTCDPCETLDDIEKEG